MVSPNQTRHAGGLERLPAGRSEMERLEERIRLPDALAGGSVTDPILTPFRFYLALGDSISIDLYPGLDVQEREGLPLPPDGLGAASLFFRNDDGRWPAFAGRDLSSRFPGVERLDLTADGATMETVLGSHLPRIPRALPGPVLVTLTVGGNHLLGFLELGFGGLAPTDGTADLGDGIVRREEHALLSVLNRRLEAAARRRGARPIDIHAHFLGHGMREPDPAARWYWRHSIIEPSARGASEVRWLSVEAVGL